MLVLIILRTYYYTVYFRLMTADRYAMLLFNTEVNEYITYQGWKVYNVYVLWQYFQTNVYFNALPHVLFKKETSINQDYSAWQLTLYHKLSRQILNQDNL